MQNTSVHEQKITTHKRHLSAKSNSKRANWLPYRKAHHTIKIYDYSSLPALCPPSCQQFQALLRRQLSLRSRYPCTVNNAHAAHKCKKTVYTNCHVLHTNKYTIITADNFDDKAYQNKFLGEQAANITTAINMTWLNSMTWNWHMMQFTTNADKVTVWQHGFPNELHNLLSNCHVTVKSVWYSVFVSESDKRTDTRNRIWCILYSFKMWHLVAIILMIFHIIN